MDAVLVVDIKVVVWLISPGNGWLARKIIQKREEIFGGREIPPYLRIPLEKSDSS